jgi:hypothetical protein
LQNKNISCFSADTSGLSGTTLSGIRASRIGFAISPLKPDRCFATRITAGTAEVGGAGQAERR